jgi:hypothetical protein
MTQPRMPKTVPPLSRRLEAAFARLDPTMPVPDWPRAVRIGVDYSLRVVGMNPETDEEADSLARTCFILGHLQHRDPKGDPPATCTAHDHAARAGADYGRAFDLLGQIRDASAALLAYGEAIPSLPAKPLKLLQAAASGQRLRAEVLEEVLGAAQDLTDQLGMRVLRLPTFGDGPA